MAGADEAGPSGVNERSSATARTSLKKSDRVVGSAISLRHLFSGAGPATVDLVHRGPGAPLKAGKEAPALPEAAAAAEEQPLPMGQGT